VKPRNLICLVTDRHRLSPESAPAQSLDRLVTLVGAAAWAGVDIIQIRERDLEARELATLAERCVAEAGHRSRIVVNDRMDVAVGAGAHGVHLRSTSVHAVTARGLAPPGFLIGRSVHSAAEAEGVSRRGGLDYLIFGTIFPTTAKPEGHRVSGLESLAIAAGTASVPVLAIGGITLDRTEAVAKTGAAGVAAIGLFIPPAGVTVERHLTAVLSALRRVFDTREALP
jgi:thiazole tautomerase (transcriptional regulator TenI)